MPLSILQLANPGKLFHRVDLLFHPGPEIFNLTEEAQPQTETISRKTANIPEAAAEQPLKTVQNSPSILSHR